MNLCDFCKHYEEKRCLACLDFVRPTGQRVFCCNKFSQFPTDYAAVVYTGCKHSSPMDVIVIGCVGAKPAPRQRNKNQVSFNL